MKLKITKTRYAPPPSPFQGGKSVSLGNSNFDLNDTSKRKVLSQSVNIYDLLLDNDV